MAFGNSTKGLLGLIVGAPLLLAAWNYACSWSEFRRLAPPGRLVQTPTAALHFACQGAGAPTIVFEAGLGGTYLEFHALEARLAAQHQVCTYDRAGLGWSGASSLRRTAANAAAELLAALDGLAIHGPLLLVAHSYGALVALEASRRPDRLGAMVLLDPSYPRETLVEPPRPLMLASIMWLAAPLGLMRMREWFAGGEADADTQRRALSLRTSHLLAFAHEVEAIEDSSRTLRDSPPSLGDMPVIVLGRSRPEGADLDVRHAGQRQLAALSSRGQFEVVPSSGHFFYQDSPEAVLRAIRAAAGSFGPGREASVLGSCVNCGNLHSSSRMSTK